MSVLLGAVRRAVTPTLRRWESRCSGLQAWDFRQWTAVLDEALATLPAPAGCSHDLSRALAEPRGAVEKMTVLVCDRDTPVAVVPLRRADSQSSWEPVTSWITPGHPFPWDQVDLRRVLHAVGLPMTIAWWRCPGEPPRSGRVVPGPPEPTYRLPFELDAEAVWRETGLLADVRRARRKCERFTCYPDVPDGSEWVIREWGRKWEIMPFEVEDMVVAARLREATGAYRTLVFYDGNRRIGGVTSVADDGDLVGQAVYRDPDYDRCSLGTHMIDRIIAWAREQGYRGLDFGGTGAYKQRWAPEGGRKLVIAVTPGHEAMFETVRHPRRLLRRRHHPQTAGAMDGPSPQEDPGR